METDKIIPTIDIEALKVTATEFAMKGAKQAIENFYCGYESPYKKAIAEELKNKNINYNIALPDIIATLNEKLSAEIDVIANTAIAKTFIPLIQRFLIREEREINFSDILLKFISVFNIDVDDDSSVTIEKSTEYNWLDVEIRFKDKEKFNITLHLDFKSKQEGKTLYHILGLPTNKIYTKFQTMKLSDSGITLELPYTKDVLSCEFMSYIARLVLGNCLITMDVWDFEESMYA